MNPSPLYCSAFPAERGGGRADGLISIYISGEPDGRLTHLPTNHTPPLCIVQLFPPSAEAAAQMGLAKCMRLLPHDHDGGGFFIAVIEKV